MIIDACRDAGIEPQDISYLECHGTGTKIGDPIEISAIQRTVAKDRKQKCFLGSIKSNIGHLESAAGIAGLIKSVLITQYGMIPPNLHFKQPNQYIDFDSYNLKVATEMTKIDKQAHIGISSFGFGGSNAHIVIQGAAENSRKKIQNIKSPFDRDRAALLTDYFQLDDDFDGHGLNLPSNPGNRDVLEKVGAEDHESNGQNNKKLSREDVQELIQGLFFKVTSIESIDPDVELIEQGLDSMSITEFVSQLQSTLEIDIDPDLLFEHPLPDQLIDQIHALI